MDVFPSLLHSPLAFSCVPHLAAPLANSLSSCCEVVQGRWWRRAFHPTSLIDHPSALYFIYSAGTARFERLGR